MLSSTCNPRRNLMLVQVTSAEIKMETEMMSSDVDSDSLLAYGAVTNKTPQVSARLSPSQTGIGTATERSFLTTKVNGFVECVKCGSSFCSDSQLINHDADLHRNAVDRHFSCFHCDEVFHSECLVKCHTKLIHNGQEVNCEIVKDVLDCDICGRKFATTSSWMMHVRTHMSADCYRCMVCSQVFSCRKMFLDHIEDHCLGKNYDCHLCSNSFVFRISLQSHHDNDHPQERKPSDNSDRKRKLKTRHRKNAAASPCSVSESEDTSPYQMKKESLPLKQKNSQKRLSKCITLPKKTGGKPIECAKHADNRQRMPKLVRCVTCGFMFETEERMQEHARKHLEAKQFVCEICGAAYKELRTFEAHKLVHTGQKPFGCDECDKSFRSRGLLAGHKRKHKPAKRDYVCSVCGKAYRSLSTLSVHEAAHTAVKPCHCEVCGRGFSTVGNLRRHMSMHTGETRFQCEHCDQEFRTKRSMYVHMEKHVSEKEYACEICGRKFAYERNRTEHQRAHAYVKEYKERHGSAEPVLDSFRKRKGVTDPGGKCDFCGKFLPTGFGLYIHTIMHKREPLTCSHCGLKFTLKVHYDNHQAVHSGNAFACVHCSKEFVTEERMRIHEREVHTGDKPYKCEICNEAFTTRLRLKAHQRVHKGKAISCQQCSKLFVSKFALEKHIRLHDSNKTEKPYPCTKCSKTFKDEFTMVRHLQTHNVQKVQASSYSPPVVVVERASTGVGDILPGNSTVMQQNPVAGVTPPHDYVPQQQENYMTAREMEVQYNVLSDVRGTYHVNTDSVHGTIFVCGLCQQAFLNAESLVEHSKLHVY